jgi:hypothetical protein
MAEKEWPAGRKSTSYDESGYFLSLTLENVRCFGPNQKLDLSDGGGKPARWTVILGVNGTGKTTILQSLVGFEVVHLGDKPDRDWPRFHDVPFGLEGYQRRKELEFKISIEVAASLTAATSPTQIATADKERISYDVHRTGYAFAPWCCAYGAGRRLGTASLSESELDDPTATLFSDKADLRNPEEWLLRLDYAAAKSSNGDEKRGKQLARAKELLLSVLPENEINDIRLTSSKGTNPTPRAEFKTPYGWVPLRRLGYGYQTLITWVTDLANRMVERYPASLDPLGEAAVVLVDEIDLHLHPVWQRQLMDFLTNRFPKTQFIVTAHSPLVAQAAADANLVVLRREGDHVIIDNDTDNIRNWRIDQILTSDLFGLETARSPQIEKLMAERNKLLDKPKLTAADERKLKQLEAEIGELPYGESRQERKEREEIRKTLDLLSKERKSAQ